MTIAKNTVIREVQSKINRIKENDDYSRFLYSEFKAEYERACDEYNKARYEEEYSRAEKVKNMQFVESLFSNGFKKEEIVGEIKVLKTMNRLSN